MFGLPRTKADAEIERSRNFAWANGMTVPGADERMMIRWRLGGMDVGAPRELHPPGGFLIGAFFRHCASLALLNLRERR